VTDDRFSSVEVASRVDGTEIFFDPRGCAASAFVGPPMERKGAGAETTEGPGDVVIRPAVVVATAAELFS
jgi:hypothetical protein